MASVCRRFPWVALAGWLVLGAVPCDAQPAVRNVLVLQSFNRGNLPLDYFTGNFRVDLDQRAGRPVNFVQVVVGPTGFVGAPEQAVVDYIRSIFPDRPKPDLIVTVAGPAAVFARKHRQELFPDTPLLFASVDQRFLRDAPLGENETAVAVANDFPGLVDDILQLLPQTRQVFMVMGSGHTGPILASTARGRVHAISRSADVRLVRTICPFRRSCVAVRAFRATRRSCISPSARTRRVGRTRTSECSPTFTPRRMPPCLPRTAHFSAMELSAGR